MRIRLACAAGLLLYVPITVLALGLGPMQTNSSLNEPFEAKVPLVDAKVDELDTLKVGLANRAQFKRAGLDYPLTLSDLRFELVQPKAGSDYVRIWSKEPVREPVLDFLLEVNWSRGRLIREYTVLLDPARYQATSSVPPRRSAATTVSPRPRATHSPPAADTNATSDQYGPTQAGDTLWEIAQGARSGEVSMQKLMLALLEANPNAFINANINHLKQGQILRIPEAGALSAYTQAEALAEVRRHNALWEEYRQRLASSVPERSVGAEGSQGIALRGEEKPPTPAARLEVLGAAASAAEKPQESAAGKGGPGQGAGTETAQLVAEESQAVTQDENAHLSQRLKESEGLVELMRRQVQLKDDELAALQAKLAQAGEAVQKLPGETIEEQSGATEAGAETAARPSEPQGTEVSVPTEPTTETKPLAEAGPAAAPSGEATEAETAGPSQADEAAPSVGVPTEPSLAEPGGEAQPAAEVGVAPAVDSQETAETASTSVVQAPAASVEPGGGLADAAPPASETQQEGAAVADPVPVDDVPFFPGGIYNAIGLIAVAGMFVFWVFWRMRAKSQGAKDEDELTGEVPSQPAGVSGFAGTRPDEDEEAPVVERTLEDLRKQAHDHDVEADMEQEVDRTRFSTELAGEKDPLEEVNLCIAYERFDEAEQLVKTAIAAQPGRHDYKLRLLEVYYAAGNKGAYERAARELSTAVGGQGPLWDNAIAMWYEMSPERPLFAEQSGEDDRRRDMDAQREVLDITSVRGGEPWKSESSPERAGLEMASALDFDLGTTQEKELATPISARGGSEEAREYTDVFDLSSPEDAASEGIVDVTTVGEDTSDVGQMFDLTVAETTSGAEDVLDLTAVDGQGGVDQEMLDLTVADNAANADEILDLTTAGSDYQEDGLDFDITGGHQVPETAEESEDALHLTVPKASFPSAKRPEPQEQVFEITHPTERSGRGTEDRSLEIGQETVELPPQRNTPPGADAPDEAIQTVDLFQYFQKEGTPGAGDDAVKPDAPRSPVEDAVPEAAESNPFVVSVDNENSEVGDAETDLGQSYPEIQILTEPDGGSGDAAEGEHNAWEVTGEENEWRSDTADVPSLSEHRSQQSSWQDQGVSAEGEASQEQAQWSAYRDSAQWMQNEARTPSEERGEAEAGHGQSLASSEHVGFSPPEEEELEVENVGQYVTMSNTVQLPQDAFATGSGRDSAAGENDFVVIADLTAPEEVVVIDLAEKTQEIGDTQENDRFANTVRLPRAFPAAAGEPSDLDTKLNLAKAYIELGDPKGARAILDEVAHSGSDVQKHDAETLRRQLG